MEWRNSPTRYGLVAMLLHWLIALAVLAMLALGFVMGEVREGSALQFQLFQWHKSIGITILLLTVLRLTWRLMNRQPPFPPTMRPWERALARATHFGFYVLLFALPLSGWAMVSTSPLGIPTLLYGVVPWPNLPWAARAENPEALEATLSEAHELLAFGMIALLVLHVAGALRHHFLLHDTVLRRMLPLPERQTGM
jgi:cytochrome b561